MKKTLTAIFLFFLTVLSCSDAEYSTLYPANPPSDIEIVLLSSDNLNSAYSSYSGDYLLLFRSENTDNARFGGFLIFIDPDKTEVEQQSTEDEADCILGIFGREESSSIYNQGIDTQIAVLFSNTNSDEIIVDDITYTITSTQDKSGLTSGYWLTMRTYLYNSSTEEIIENEISSRGNVVEIP